MEFYDYPSSSSSHFSFGVWVERVRDICSSAVTTVLGNLVSAIFTFFFAMG
uniref:Uncharacterized protein n=1 Tax=Nelumbo nucifera TaxID=4432 RepID=A0A822ZP79_NELNU|nr:TPA_asm: hypothetical protein HUJ06_016644 [Nelumbo nucifera]